MSAKQNCDPSSPGPRSRDNGGLRSRRAFLRAVLSAAAAGPILGVMRAFALRICGRCGHEALGDERLCGHCGAELPGTADPAAPAPQPTLPPPEDPGAEREAQVRRAAAQQAMTAERLTEQENWIGALLFARNARALFALAGDTANSARLAEPIRRARAALATVRVDCPLCEGTGHRRARAISLQGEAVEHDVVGSPCALCRGRRTLPGLQSRIETNRIIADAQRVFAQAQRENGFDLRTGIWIPAPHVEGWTARRIADQRRAFEAWCGTCHRLGRLACDRCSGTRVTRCTNDGCIHGVETCPACGGRGRVDGRRCGDCQGMGRRECARCLGRGYTECADCEGRGDHLCRICNGAGHPPACTRCDGDGTLVCRRCRGTGVQRDLPCTVCGGEGRSLCTACNGFGRRVR